MTTSAIKIASIIRFADTQFRANMDDDNVVAMMDLIERGISFKTKIRLAQIEDHIYLIDGFHRLEAYERLRITEIPADQYEVVPASSLEEVRIMAMGANVAHGKGTTEADYYIIIKKMMGLGDGKYMKNVFEADIKKIAEALGAPRPRVNAGYSDYFPNGGPSLSQQCKERRDAAILEKHKEGLSVRKIGELFGVGKSTVDEVIKQVSGNTESVKSDTPEVSTSTVPMESTEDRSDTRATASFVNEQLEELLGPDYLDSDGNAAFSLSEDEADAPAARFDVLTATGYGEDLCQHTKPSKPATEYERVEAAKANPVKLQEKWMTLCDEEEVLKAKLAEIVQRKSQVRRIATQCGVSLPE
ncbi:ParB N-terminal domain-containing protein [Aeromonas veronii]|uniref:ParB N-terminal domain-containing protein n=1 Tax=Aeromonas veronii TaxID=654 RepID=UPI00142FD1F2|nr:ParB N-terminal domain-containing protein [Aeromonas veronii]NJI21570.1 ParB N-terminal domain-containing protein [Aeromonas veronii]NJI35081.1 ParB N-terminal domain-containing protein [Aeromonas veronii]